ncbi:MAG: DUF309 domain-containing protein [Planctomycetales bacterium]|nr:DUF309 domain-containing protein [Planctomycetales bacterium]
MTRVPKHHDTESRTDAADGEWCSASASVPAESDRVFLDTVIRHDDGPLLLYYPRWSHRKLPEYSYVSGRFPHPSSQADHLATERHPIYIPRSPTDWSDCEWYRYGIDLYNHGYYWESHEVWESGWHGLGRAGPAADFLKGLIKLAAAGVKAREGNEAGVRRHARRAAQLFLECRRGRSSGAGCCGGLALDALEAMAGQWNAGAATIVARACQFQSVNLGWRLQPRIPAVQSQQVRVCSPSRLHFGLSSFAPADAVAADPERTWFGGLGVVLETPQYELVVRRTMDAPSTTVTNNARVNCFLQRWQRTHPTFGVSWVTVDVVQRIPGHAGLGSGTQLGLSLAHALNGLWGVSTCTPHDLARSVGRGLRSAVGTYGFTAGGLLVDGGKRTGEELGQLELQAAVPYEWRFVLVRRTGQRGCHGDAERQAFDHLRGTPPEISDRLRRLIAEQIVPALATADCAAFGDAVHTYGKLAGECFRPCQGGPFADASVAQLVATIRRLGISGVGQSSWGPTVFAITPDQATAQGLVETLRNQAGDDPMDYHIARPRQMGTSLEPLPDLAETSGQR